MQQTNQTDTERERMKKRIVDRTLLAGLLLVAVTIAACGDSGNSNAQPTNTVARRTAAPTRAPGTGATPTQDVLDDSADNPPADDSNNGPRPTQDVLDDSDSGGNLPRGPQTQDGKVVLPDTAWTEITGDQLYLFCQNNAWEIVQGGDTVAQQGTFAVNGDTLAMTNSADQKVTEYQMQWNEGARTLKLIQGGKTLTLDYEDTADCSE